MDIKANIGEHNTIEVRTYYTKGGVDYFRGGTIKRGIFISVHAVTVKYERGFESRSFTMFANDDKDFKYMVKEMPRGNKKKLAEIKAKVESIDTSKVIDFYKAGDKRGIVEMVTMAIAA